MILLVHHAEAVSPAVEPSRPLTARGLSEAARVAAAVEAHGFRPEVIWHSGKLRARQTAEPLWRLNPLAAFAAVRGLQPDDPPAWMRDQLAGETRRIVCVGHMPHLPRLLRLLVSGNADTPDVLFPEHGCVALEAEGERWVETWRVDLTKS